MAWITGAASVEKQIRDHAHVCQDAYAVDHLNDQTVVAVLADGAGSASHAKEGADITVKTALAELKKLDLDHLSEDTMTALQSVPERVQQALQYQATKAKEPLESYASTLIAVVFTPTCLVGVQVGDGFLVSGVQDDYDLIFSGKKGEYVNETNFVTDPQIDAQYFIQREPLNFVALATDGLEHVAIDNRLNEAHIGFFKPFDTFLTDQPDGATIDTELQNFLSSKRLQQRSNDDRTLIIAKYIEDS